MQPGPPRPPPRRLTGIGGLIGVLRNLGAFGRGEGPADLPSIHAEDGLRIPVRTWGAGRPVVLVHGLGCSHRVWVPVARRLARHHRVVAWDARGHGACVAAPGSAIRLPMLGRDLHQLVSQFGLDRPVLVGHSMGALAVMQYLHDHGTAAVAGVGFVDQSPRVVTDEEWRLGLFGGCSAEMLLGWIGGARSDLAETVVRELDRVLGGRLHTRLAADAVLGRWIRQRLRRIDTAPLLDLAESLAVADFRALMPRLDVPVWIALGGRSLHYGNVPLDAYYRETVPHAAIERFERSGHSPHVAEPRRFAQSLLRFIDDHA